MTAYSDGYKNRIRAAMGSYYPAGDKASPPGWDEYQAKKAEHQKRTAEKMLEHYARQLEPSEIAKKHARSKALARRMRWK
jgi:hypothetical protein